MKVFDVIGRIRRHPLNRNRQMAAVLRFLRWQLGSRLLPGQVLYPWIDGTVVAVARGDAGFTGNIYCGLLEFPEMAYVLHVADERDVFVDVGANLGAYTLLACGARGAGGVCFEPVPDTYRRLMRNLRINDLLRRVEALNQAAGDAPGNLHITSKADCENHVVGAEEVPGDSISVPVTTLDSALRGRRATILKIDVEGFETAVVEGADATLRDPALHSVILELNGSGTRYGFDEAALAERIADYGFLPQAYDPFERTLAATPAVGGWTGNALFVRDSARMWQVAKQGRKVSINGVSL